MARDSTRQSDQHSSTAACQVVDDTFSVAHKHFTEDGGLPEAVGGVPASTAPSVCGDAQVHIPTSGPSSIYSLYHTRRRNCILLAAAFASILVPFSDTIYLPALTVIQHDLATSPELVAASVSIYMFVVGLAALVAGPAADKFGRLPTYMVSTVAFIGATIGCVFSPTAEVLVLFRALQGAGVAAFMTTGSGVIADIFPPEERGTASGVYLMPHLVGPVLGPLLGGALSQAWGWRSTFICLAVFAALAGLAVVALIRTETHQYFVLQRLAKKDPEAAKGLAEWHSVTSQVPVFHAPWVPLRYLLEPAIWPHALVALVSLATIFGVLTELPGALSSAPYSMSAGIVGVAYLADGIPSLIFAPVGGILSDWSAAKHPNVPEFRLVYNTLTCLITMPVGLLIYAWTMHTQAHLVGIFAGMVVVSFGCAIYLPGLFAYITTVKQSAAAAAAAAVTSLMFIASGVIVLVSAIATRAIGYGPWFSILAGIQLAVCAFAYIVIMRKQRASVRAGQEMPAAACQLSTPAQATGQAV